jgi:hypothetical protein
VDGLLAACSIRASSTIGGRVERPKCSVEVAEDEILKDNWTPAIDTLRAYRNYLTPHSGLASSDTWAAVVLWLINTLIKWSLIVPLLPLDFRFPRE